MLSPPRPCGKCGKPVSRNGLCSWHYAQRERRRGSPTERGYGTDHEQRFRSVVLQRDPTCVICDDADSVAADHYPMSRRELVRNGLDANNPDYGRGLCVSCHNGYTASTQTR